MRADDIELPAAAFTWPADQLQILVAHPNDESAIVEVGRTGCRALVLQSQVQAIAGLADLAFAAPWVARDTEAIAANPGERGIRWVRGECRRIKTHNASKIEVLPWALSPTSNAPAAGTSRSNDPKHRKSINRKERSTSKA